MNTLHLSSYVPCSISIKNAAQIPIWCYSVWAKKKTCKNANHNISSIVCHWQCNNSATMYFVRQFPAAAAVVGDNAHCKGLTMAHWHWDPNSKGSMQKGCRFINLWATVFTCLLMLHITHGGYNPQGPTLTWRMYCFQNSVLALVINLKKYFSVTLVFVALSF